MQNFYFFSQNKDKKNNVGFGYSKWYFLSPGSERECYINDRISIFDKKK